ncbi:Uma2 family endonuclease [Sorangium sp. So ce315]|uniref:Uma2 family endonuclease n=1 Tax=Sorangium sp. So ce315 TaxID=3133299 RepID=UPI003F60B92B
MGFPAEKRQRATLADLEAVPPPLVGELIRGTLYVFPRPAPPHAHASSVLGADLVGPFQRGRGGPGGWRILDEPELLLGPPGDEDDMVPDLAGWRIERMPRLPTTAKFTLAPDWVCEVLSPGTVVTDRAEKMPAYARHGVRHLWLLDPLARTLEVFALEAGRWVVVGVHHGSARVRAEPFDAIELELSALWDGAEEAPQEGVPAAPAGEPAPAPAPRKPPPAARKGPRKRRTRT